MLSPLTNDIYEIILHAINAGVWVWDIKTGDEWWSDKYYRLLDYEPGEIEPSYNAFLYELVHPEDRHLFIDANKNPVIVGVTSPVEVRLKLKDGSYRWFEATGKLIFNKEGEPIKMTGSIIDRNDSKILQAELQHSINVTTDQNKRLNNFAQIVTHNLRSHAANMQYLLSSITPLENKNSGLEESLLYLARISDALNQTINHLAEVVRIQTDINLSKVTVQFQEAFDLTTGVLAPDIKKSGAVIDVDFSGCPQINYIYAYLESIFLNLISNCIKYRHTERAPVINIRTYTNGEKSFLKITDNGLGIDLNKNRDKLFGLYNVFHKHPESKGIGLYITKNQVESLGGSITAESELGKGTSFIVQF
ncbi:MAG: PAS domain-containing sensor histidine kinase [Ginsengibacter sp.]